MHRFPCVMGCPREDTRQLHRFPTEPSRRAEWSRILGVYPRSKHVFICSNHFSNCYIFGNRITKFAKPNPPESRYSNLPIISNAKHNKEPDGQTEDTNNESFEYTMPKKKKVVKERIIYSKNIGGSDANKKEESKETVGKVENFEIRKGSTNDMIIKGRFVQTNDYLVVSYTPPRKWTLHQQVKLLDEKCTQQLRTIRKLNQENTCLFRDIQKYKKLLPKLRYLQSTNRFLYGLLKLKNQQRLKRLQQRRNKRLQTNLENTQA